MEGGRTVEGQLVRREHKDNETWDYHIRIIFTRLPGGTDEDPKESQVGKHIISWGVLKRALEALHSQLLQKNMTIMINPLLKAL